MKTTQKKYKARRKTRSEPSSARFYIPFLTIFMNTTLRRTIKRQTDPTTTDMIFFYAGISHHLEVL